MRVFGTPLFSFVCAIAAAAGVWTAPAAAQDRPSGPVFRSSVALVSVAAVVRDKRGRVIQSLTREDFQLLDAGQPRPLIDFQSDASAAASVTILLDGSGSMAGGASAARHVSDLLLAQLRPEHDEAALMSFDTRLMLLRDYTGDFDRIRRGLREVDAFGASSIYDAIAGTAGLVADRTGMRRAVVVITDGTDNASAYTPDQVASIASAIDVPVYVFAVGHGVPQTPADTRRAWARSTPLMDLARATGGDFFFAGTATDRALAVARVLDELRHQYLIAFEPAMAGGVRRLEVRMRNNDLKVRSRHWYVAGSAN